MPENESPKPRKLIALCLDFASPQSERLKQQLEGFVKSLNKQDKPPVEACVSLVGMEDLEKVLPTCEPVFVLIDYKRALEEELDLNRISALRQKAFVALIVPEYFSNRSFEALLKESPLPYDFVSRSRFWDTELMDLVRIVAERMRVESRAKNLERQEQTYKRDLGSLREEVRVQRKAIEALEVTVANSTMFDPATGLETNHAFLSRLDSAIEEASRHNDNVALLHVAINNEPQITEAYGNEGKRFVVGEVAKWIKKTLRASDSASFHEDSGVYWLMLKRIHPKSVSNTCYRFKRSLENKTFYYKAQYKLQVSLSIGVSSTINYKKNTFEVGVVIDRAVIALKNAIKKDANQNVVSYI